MCAANTLISADITLNGTLIVDAQLNSIDYTTVTDENYTDLIQEFYIAFKSPIADLVMNEDGGYERGYTIYVTKGKNLREQQKVLKWSMKYDKDIRHYCEHVRAYVLTLMLPN
ncbi:hypothetical protein KIN20_028652 [Parelaphostrongylus tenuis]|uniref:Uncharacterized protein n=1 Tax=Parelaphostrongylus tenuis TaxID=148309 RepID=A0AAD5R140_PARTN|nr:hypothetical protein KIN20_028652 [Parelaphostrongylus tenuis]